MYRIGEFSQLGRVTVNTLRHYDGVGLLTPAHVDSMTGYRYYTAGQLPRLYRILALKELGLGLEEIGRFLDEDLSLAEMKGILKWQQKEAERQIEAEQARLVRVATWLRQLESEGKMPEFNVVIKKVETEKIASMREVVPTIDLMGERCRAMFDNVGQWLGQQRIKPGFSLAVYHNMEYTEKDIDAECGFLIDETNLSGQGMVGIRPLPGREMMACIVYHGSFDGLTAAWGALGQWIADNGYQVVGPSREIYLEWQSGEPVTELQYPVAKV